MTQAKNETGNVYGQLTVLAPAESSGKGQYWLVRCECGTEKVVSGVSLRSGRSQSCGCSRIGKVGRPATPKFIVEAIITLYNAGFSYREMQDYIDVNLRTISTVINANLDKITRPQYNSGRPR